MRAARLGPADDAAIYEYGFLSARAAGALQAYSDSGALPLPSENAALLREADTLVKDVFKAQRLAGLVKEGVGDDIEVEGAKDRKGASESTLNAFSCALQVIGANQERFAVTTAGELVDFLVRLHKTILALIEGQSEAAAPAGKHLEDARTFFRDLSKLMLARVSVVTEEDVPAPQQS